MPIYDTYEPENAGMPLRFYSLGKDFTVVKTVNVDTIIDATAAIADYLVGSGYTNLRTINDGDGSLRFIADPPTGRKGRNVAALDF